MSDEENAALVIKTGIERMAAPLQRLVDQLVGPAASEVGLALGDSVKVWRFKRQLRLLQEVNRLIERSGHKTSNPSPLGCSFLFSMLPRLRTMTKCRHDGLHYLRTRRPALARYIRRTSTY
jgi:hypothetical protein